jgi:trans-aconitate methyltransferase
MTHHEARRTTARLYKSRRDLYYYTHGKIALDPAYPWVAAALQTSNRPLLDLGCGAGQLAGYLRASGHSAPILGIDVDAKKIEIARSVLPSCQFEVGDARNLPDHVGDVVMLDVLHYFDPEQRRKLLLAIADRVAPDGMAILRVTLKDASWRFTVTRMEEWFVRFSGWIPFPSVGFPERRELESVARESGLKATILPMWGVTPFNSYLLRLRKTP